MAWNGPVEGPLRAVDYTPGSGLVNDADRAKPPIRQHFWPFLISPSGARVSARTLPWVTSLSALSEGAGLSEGVGAGIGSKALNLARLSGAGLPVPAGFALSADAFQELCGAGSLAERRARIHESELPSGLSEAIQAAARELPGPYVVRSAGLDEDAAGASAAGIYRSLIGVAGDELEPAIRACWASALSPAAEAYRAQRGGSAPPRMAVLIQTLITPHAAGVLFSEGSQGDRVWVEAVGGHGEPLVSGEADPVRYRYRWSGEEVLDLRTGGAPAGLLTVSSLEELGRLARSAEEALGSEGGLDLEWAADSERIWLVQARPITATLPGELFEAERVCWTAANTQEALLDPVTPLTWSLLSPLVESGRRDLFRFAGLDEIEGPGYLRLFAGRPYFNPGYFRDFLRQIPGVPEDVFDALIFGAAPSAIRFRLEAFDTTTLRLIALFLLSRVAARERFELFARVFRLRLGLLESRRLETLYDTELLELRRQATDLCEGALRRHVLGTAIAGGAYLLLELFLSRWSGERGSAPGVAARLTAGAEGNALALASAELEALARDRAAGDAPGEAAAALAGFLERFGHRCEKEAELAEPRWSDSPRVVEEILEGYVAAARQGELTDLRRRERELSERAQALAEEIRAELAASSRLERILPLKRAAFAWILREARRYAPYRENLKDHGLRALWLLRRVFLETGRRLAARGLLASPDDVFYVELEAVEAALSDGRDLRAEAQGAREERARASETPPPRHVIEAPGRAPRWVHAAPHERGLLEGVGVSSGVARGRARVLSSMDEAQRLAPGEILVARVINAAWTPLFHLAGGIVAEVGGVLSHGAIVAREYGIPAVFGAAGAAGIEDGAWIEVDGDLGLVTPAPEVGDSDPRDSDSTTS
jgi:rifampicin phosphotransferase